MLFEDKDGIFERLRGNGEFLFEGTETTENPHRKRALYGIAKVPRFTAGKPSFSRFAILSPEQGGVVS